MTEILHSIAVTIAGLLASALTALVVAQLKKRGFDLSQDQKAALDDEAKSAILYAEELAASGAIKEAEKLPAALAWIARRNPKSTATAASDAIHAALPELASTFGAGATAADAPQDLYDPTKSVPAK